MRYDLEGKRIVVLGATGGIGQVLTKALGEQGARVYVQGHRKQSELDDLSALSHVEGGMLADFRDPAVVEGFFAEISSLWGGFDSLVSTLGVNPTAALLRDVTAQEFDLAYQVNVRAVFLAIKYGLPLTDGSPRARFIIVSSIFGLESPANRSAYGSSKHALAGLIQTLTKEEGDRIRINGVCPGPLWGENVRRIFERHAQEKGISIEEYVRQRVSKIPVGTFLEPLDFSQLIMFLCSDASDYINGELIRISGGAVE